MIDLHLHTTASDGRCDAPTLVRRAWQAGLRTIAVTDHDSTAAVADATRAGRDFGIRVIAGIEITAVLDEEDVHVLGYFIDPDDHELAAFIAGSEDAGIWTISGFSHGKRRNSALGLRVRRTASAPARLARRKRSGGWFTNE